MSQINTESVSTTHYTHSICIKSLLFVRVARFCDKFGWMHCVSCGLILGWPSCLSSKWRQRQTRGRGGECRASAENQVASLTHWCVRFMIERNDAEASDFRLRLRALPSLQSDAASWKTPNVSSHLPQTHFRRTLWRHDASRFSLSRDLQL